MRIKVAQTPVKEKAAGTSASFCRRYGQIVHISDTWSQHLHNYKAYRRPATLRGQDRCRPQEDPARMP